jgi:outer membrane receptor protein involved in Fe transport
MAGLNKWLFANSISDVTNKMDVFSASINGSPLDLPAGPVSVSLNAEYRNNSLVRSSNSDPAVPINTFGGAVRGAVFNTRFGITNTGLIDGSNNVKEGGIEVLAPITSPQSAIGELAVSAAGRWTDYSNSGTVYTWKGGATWAPVDELRFRATRSRDIRAPNLFELFAGRTAGPANTAFQAPFNTTSGNLLVEGGGNASLKPEVANTLTFGAVIEPTSNLSVSADFYDINLSDAIQSVPFQTIVGQCGSSGFSSPVCSNITLRGGGKPTPALMGTSPTITNVFSGPVNLASIRTRGIDIDASYTVPLGAGQLNLQANANVLLSFKSKSSAAAPIVSQAGYIDTADSILLQDSIQPKLRSNISARYVADSGLNLFLQARYIGKLNQGEVPGLTAGQQTFVYAQKTIGSVVYVDANISQTIKTGLLGSEMEIFANVNNLFNKRPPIFANPTQPGNTYPTYARLYDVMGRYITVGAKMKF